MSLTAGSLSQVAVSDVQAQVLATAPTSGTTPYSYQYYRATASNFVPGGGNIITGATALALTDSSLTPGTIYYYKQIQIDSAATPASVTTSQLVVTTLAPQVSQNQFNIQPFLGMLDLQLNYNTIAAQFDPAGSGTLVGGQAVKWSTVAGGVPKVVPSTAQADVIAGFVNYDIKTASYVAGNRIEMSQVGNVMFLYAALAINRGQEVCSIPAAVAGGCNGGVVPVTGSSGFPIVGFALDTAAIGQLVRIELRCPSGRLDA